MIDIPIAVYGTSDIFIISGSQQGCSTVRAEDHAPSIAPQECASLTGVLMHGGTCTPMFIAALSTIAKLEKEPKCPSTDEWRKKMWFIYTMEYHLAMRKNDIWPFAATWMELEGLLLSEISQAEKDRYHMFSLTCGS